MEKNISFKFPDDKLKALEVFLKDKGTTLEKEMTAAAQHLYEKTVPASVRNYVEVLAGRSRPTSGTGGQHGD